MRRSALAALLVLFIGSCASASRSEWTPPPRSAERFDQAWAAPILGDEYARLGVLGLSMGESYGAWTVVSFIEASDGSFIARKTEGDERGDVADFVADSRTCEAVSEAVDGLRNFDPPAMRDLEIMQEFSVPIERADVRLRVRTYFGNGAEPVSLVTMELWANCDSPIFAWYENLRVGAADCWTPSRRASA